MSSLIPASLTLYWEIIDISKRPINPGAFILKQILVNFILSAFFSLMVHLSKVVNTITGLGTDLLWPSN